MQSLLRRLIRRPVAVAMFMMAAAATGLYQAWHLPLELAPEVDFPKLSVTASWPGSAPENVEAFVTSPIEAVAHTLPHVRKASSESFEGRMRVAIEFNRRAEMDFITLELGEKLSNLARELPFGVSTPQIEAYIPKEFQTEGFLSYQLAGDLPPHALRTFALEKLRGPLLSLNGIAAVEVLGGEERELHILVDRARLETYALTLAEVQQALVSAQLRRPVGRLVNAAQQVDLVLESFEETIDRLAQLPLTKNGITLTLNQIATLQFQIVPPLTVTRIDGKPAVMLRILRQPGTNSLQVADAVCQKIETLKGTFPGDLRLLNAQDETARLRTDLRDLFVRSCVSLLVVLSVLLLFLRSWRASGIVIATVFLAVLLALNLFGMAGLGLNLLTLAGFALGIGILVDNAIVVVENIARLRAGEGERGRLGERETGGQGEWESKSNSIDGQDDIEIAARGTAEVGVAILASTLTAVVAFIPFLYLAGELREYYQSFALAVCASLAASLLVAFALTPTLAARLSSRKEVLKKRASPRNPPASVFPTAPFLRLPFHLAYQRLLVTILRFRWLTLLLALGLFGGSLYVFLKKVTRGSPWKWGEETHIVAWVQLPTGAQLERADAIARFFEERIVNQPQVDRVFTQVSAENVTLRLSFTEAARTSLSPLLLKEQLTLLATRIAGVGIGISGFGPGFATGVDNVSQQFPLRVLGYSYAEVKKFAEEIGRVLSRHPRVSRVNTSGTGWYTNDTGFETVLAIDRQKLRGYGLTVQSTLAQLGAYLREDFTRQEMQVHGEPMIYRVKFSDFERLELQSLFTLTLRGEEGQQVHLREIAHLEERPAQSSIARENQQYQRWITFEFRGPWKLARRFAESIAKHTLLPPGYRLEQPQWGRENEGVERELWKVIALSLLLIFMVTAALFESYQQPFIIMTAVPLALIGVFAVFWMTDQPFDRSAYIGVVLLGGIVVNNAIIMVDHINQLRERGLEKHAAIIAGASHRLRPILMTSLTTIAGLLPMVIAADKTGLWYALALATIGGISSAAILGLLVTPAIYAVISGRD